LNSVEETQNENNHSKTITSEPVGNNNASKQLDKQQMKEATLKWLQMQEQERLKKEKQLDFVRSKSKQVDMESSMIQTGVMGYLQSLLDLQFPKQQIDIEGKSPAQIADDLLTALNGVYTPVDYFCRCKSENINSLRKMQAGFLEQLIEDNGALLNCHFCNASHEISVEQIRQILKEQIHS
jgi:uncharacterized membrane protein YheB (UPF0754 family)